MFWYKDYKEEWKNITQPLLYEDISYEYAIQNGIELVAESDVFLLRQV